MPILPDSPAPVDKDIGEIDGQNCSREPEDVNLKLDNDICEFEKKTILENLKLKACPWELLWEKLPGSKLPPTHSTPPQPQPGQNQDK